MLYMNEPVKRNLRGSNLIGLNLNTEIKLNIQSEKSEERNYF